VYGDKNGNIGYWCGTRVPIRGKQTATLPLPGWDKSAEWRGFVPFDQMPHLYNPPQSYIATANNKVADESFPHHISDLWEPPSRIQRLHRVLSREGTFSIQDFERLQNDLYSVYAEEMLPHILAACLDSAVEIPEHQRILEYLRNWNLNFTREDIATTIFQATFVRLLHNIYQDEMGDDLFHDFVILGNIPLRVTLRLVMEGTSTWFDDMMTPDIESCNDILRKSVGEAVRELQSKLGTEMKAWRWGALHTLTLQHPFGLQKPLDRIFNVGPFPVAGGPTVLASSEYSFNEPYGVTVAASFRRIVDFARPDEVRSVLPSGQCGQVFHDHYDDQTQLWLSGAYRTFRTDSAVVSGPGWDRLTLKPKK
jgi:penicillin amidase